MQIIPAIDLMNGKVVRLEKGDFATQKVYFQDPTEYAKILIDAGLERLHLVDLDGAKQEKPAHLHILERIAKLDGLQIDYSGGIGTEQQVKDCINAGAKWISLSSIPVLYPDRFVEWVENFGADLFIIGADFRGDFISVRGWTTDTQLRRADFIERILDLGIRQVFATDIERDGMKRGPSIEIYKNLLEQFPNLQLIASGGVSTEEDLDQLQEIGCFGAILGKALLEGDIPFKTLEKFKTNPKS